MNGKQRDELEVRRTAALEGIAGELREVGERRRKEEYRQPPTRMRSMFGGERGAVSLLRSIPGFAELWRREVPERAIIVTVDRDRRTWRIVLCPCGEQVVLCSGALGDCACGRWFFSTGRTVRVRRFELAAA